MSDLTPPPPPPTLLPPSDNTPQRSPPPPPPPPRQSLKKTKQRNSPKTSNTTPKSRGASPSKSGTQTTPTSSKKRKHKSIDSPTAQSELLIKAENKKNLTNIVAEHMKLASNSKTQCLSDVVSLICRKFKKDVPKPNESITINLSELDYLSLRMAQKHLNFSFEAKEVVYPESKSRKRDRSRSRKEGGAKAKESTPSPAKKKKLSKRDQAKMQRLALNKPLVKLKVDKELFCLCHREDTGQFMIECTSKTSNPRCNNWVHPPCVKLNPERLEKLKLKTYVCSLCTSALKGLDLDFTCSPEQTAEPICAFCNVGNGVNRGLGLLAGPIQCEYSGNNFMFHEYCAMASHKCGKNVKKQWYNVAKTRARFQNIKCSKALCKCSKKTHPTLKCTKCQNRCHLLCCEPILKRLRNIPVIRSSSVKVHAVAVKAYEKMRMRILREFKQSYLCDECSKRYNS